MNGSRSEPGPSRSAPRSARTTTSPSAPNVYSSTPPGNSTAQRAMPPRSSHPEPGEILASGKAGTGDDLANSRPPGTRCAAPGKTWQSGRDVSRGIPVDQRLRCANRIDRRRSAPRTRTGRPPMVARALVFSGAAFADGPEPTRVLLIEDDDGDALLVEGLLLEVA